MQEYRYIGVDYRLVEHNMLPLTGKEQLDELRVRLAQLERVDEAIQARLRNIERGIVRLLESRGTRI
jgi:hypothetical protein